MMTPALREAIRRAEELDARERVAATMFLCVGLAHAWAAYRVAHPPEQLWALHDDEHSLTVFATLEEALADRANEEHTIAKIHPCCVAMPTIDAEDLIDRINDHGSEHFPADWGMDYQDHPDCDLIEFADVDDSSILDELTEALSDAFAVWARKHVGDAHVNSSGKIGINAWNFTGPARRFVHRVVSLHGSAVWIELCPKTIAHGAHNCTLPLGHAGECDPELG